MVRHSVKAPQGSAITAGGGSIAFMGQARSALVAAVDPEDENAVILASVKCNLSRKPASLRYRIVETPDGLSHIEWRGVSSHTADTLLDASRDTEERGATNEAVNWLSEFLRKQGARRPSPRRSRRQRIRASFSERWNGQRSGSAAYDQSEGASAARSYGDCRIRTIDPPCSPTFRHLAELRV